ncbi:hypothetical protein ACFVWR_02795 [Leifsonia sp. NPDC058292]
MDKDAQEQRAVAVTIDPREAVGAPASLPDPAAVDDSDEEDGTL